ncbi:hypothetical protein MKW94_021735 [Papaver nudicaule]|uniref:Uncharacterized protein n=1 Tax=Papaver nudicaule TaxID=74823 RepID=A0AA41RZV3_PAPNU|nr:hypothetical protein [Papaver nudicaule]
MYGNPWTDTEDIILSDYIKKNGEGGWSNLPTKAGLKRCGEGCRQRWLNFLRPDIKRGNISSDEEELIIKLHKLLGNSWSSIATRLPGRTGYEIKNYWNLKLAKKIQGHSTSSSNRKSSIQSKKKKRKVSGTPVKTRTLSEFVENRDKIRGSTDHCKEMEFESRNGFLGCPLRGRNLTQNYEMDCNHGENCCFSEFSQLWNFSAEKADDFLSPSSDGCSLFLDEMLQIRTGNDVPSDIQSLADVLGSEEDWPEE